jgi:predicted transcriptional regulator
MISFKTFTEEFDLIQVLTDEDIDEAITESIVIPTDIAVKIPGVKGMLYKKAVRHYLDWRKKNPNKGTAGLAKIAREVGIDAHELSKVLHKLIKQGKLPSHLATNPNMLKGKKPVAKMLGKAGFLQK